jgi:hypothetical protein
MKPTRLDMIFKTIQYLLVALIFSSSSDSRVFPRTGHGGEGMTAIVGNEEFAGPFPNWINAKTTGKRIDGTGPAVCTGATGDGSTDDSAALQSCFNILGSANPVIYLPPGTYRVKDVCTTSVGTASAGATSIVVASAIGIRPGNLVVGTGIQVGSAISGADMVALSYTPGNTTISLTSPITNPLAASSPLCFTLGIYSQIQIAIIGHDPNDTIIKWNGSSGGAMLGIIGVTQSNFRRLTLDGNSTAGILADQSWDSIHNYFDTFNEYADIWWQNAAIGLRCGVVHGCAETTVLRNKFTNLASIGILMKNFNALNMWVWYSEFLNNETGIGNQTHTTAEGGAGNFSVFNSNFQGSTWADVATGNTGAFGIRNNYSTGSKQFANLGGGNSSGAFGLSNNTVLDTTDTVSVSLGSVGTLIFTDNIVRSRSGVSIGPAVTTGGGSGPTFGVFFSMGNTCTVTLPCSGWTSGVSAGHTHLIDDQAVSRATLNPIAPTLPGVPPNTGRTIFEVMPGSSASTIQTAINNAIAAGSRSVVHLQAGSYSISTTLTTPANADIQIIGDGSSTSITGAANPILRLNGPSKVVLRDFHISGGDSVDVLEITNADQSGASVFIEDTLISAAITSNTFVDTLDHTLVELHDVGTTYDVVGGTSANAGTWLGGSVNVFAGTVGISTASNGARLSIKDTFYDDGSGFSVLLLNASGPGAVTIANSQLHSHRVPSINFNNFLGKSAIVGVGTDGTTIISGSGSGAQNLGLGMGSPLNSPYYTDSSSPISTMEFLSGLTSDCVTVSCGAPTVREIAETSADATFLRSVLNQYRITQPAIPAPSSPGVTDVRLHRLYLERGIINLWVH